MPTVTGQHGPRWVTSQGPDMGAACLPDGAGSSPHLTRGGAGSAPPVPSAAGFGRCQLCKGEAAEGHQTNTAEGSPRYLACTLSHYSRWTTLS